MSEEAEQISQAEAEGVAPKRRGRPPGAGQKPAARTTKSGRAGQKVTVACKHPPGIVMRAFEWNEEDVPVFGGGVKRQQVARPTGDQVVIHGPKVAFGVIPDFPIIGGYALTHNVDAERWDIWLEQNKNSDLVKKHQIFAYEKPEMADGWAREHVSVRSGLEGINPSSVKDKDGKERPADPRMPRGGAHITGTVTEAIPG